MVGREREGERERERDRERGRGREEEEGLQCVASCYVVALQVIFILTRQ